MKKNIKTHIEDVDKLNNWDLTLLSIFWCVWDLQNMYKLKWRKCENCKIELRIRTREVRLVSWCLTIDDTDNILIIENYKKIILTFSKTLIFFVVGLNKIQFIL